MSASADIATGEERDHVVARLTGELDVTNVDHVGDELRRSVPNDARGLVLDLGGTRYLDSAAIEMLFDLARRLRRRRQRLLLVVPPGSPLKRVLLLTEVDSEAPLHESLEGALAGA